MAINKNHEFEELNGIKCAIVEKNVSPERVEFLKQILELNQFTVVVVPSPPPKVPAAPPPVPVANVEGETTVISDPLPPPPPASFTLGVTDVTFNAVNAIFGRLLKTKTGNKVTLAYWQQKEIVSQDEIPYYENPALKK
ncbi:MAG: hypothetical protein ACXWB9_08720 [Flavisolibacter sp.]